LKREQQYIETDHDDDNADASKRNPLGMSSVDNLKTETIRKLRKPNHKKRKLIIDKKTRIEAEVMKQNIKDTSNIVTKLNLAPPTKKLMLQKETWDVKKLFALPGRKTYLGRRRGTQSDGHKHGYHRYSDDIL
jgi:hypothetical protein